MKKITSPFRHFAATIAFSTLVAGLLFVSCEKQTVSPKQTSMSISTTESSNSFNAKLKIGSKGGIEVYYPTADSNKTSTLK